MVYKITLLKSKIFDGKVRTLLVTDSTIKIPKYPKFLNRVEKWNFQFNVPSLPQNSTIFKILKKQVYYVGYWQLLALILATIGFTGQVMRSAFSGLFTRYKTGFYQF